MRNGKILSGVLLGLILFGVVAGASWYAYNVGVAQGVMQSAVLTAPAVEGNVTPVVPVTVPFWYMQSFRFGHPFGFGFGFLGCLVPIFFFLLIFALFRFAFRPYWGRGWHRYGGGPSDGDIPPQVKEWHRKLHDQESNVSSSPTGQPG